MLEITVNNLKIHHDDGDDVPILVAYLRQQHRGTATQPEESEEQASEAVRVVQKLLQECGVHGRITVMTDDDPADCGKLGEDTRHKILDSTQ